MLYCQHIEISIFFISGKNSNLEPIGYNSSIKGKFDLNFRFTETKYLLIKPVYEGA